MASKREVKKMIKNAHKFADKLLAKHGDNRSYHDQIALGLLFAGLFIYVAFWP
jgi:hypothetical protein